MIRGQGGVRKSTLKKSPLNSIDLMVKSGVQVSGCLKIIVN